jgi:uncharacterized damage-inducible protein DinB
MQGEIVRALYDYGDWATNRVLDAASGLTETQWLSPGGAGRGSIRDTLVHMIGTQKGWTAWWDGSLPAMEAYALSLDPNDFADAEALRREWASVSAVTRAFAAGLTDADLQRVYSTPMPNGMAFALPLWQMMVHVANHGTQHRSEAAAMLTEFDRSPGDLDALYFFDPIKPAPAR